MLGESAVNIKYKWVIKNAKCRNVFLRLFDVAVVRKKVAIHRAGKGEG